MKSNINKHVGMKIKSLRLRNGMTQKELGEKIGVKHNTISSYEKGTNEPEQDILFHLADVLGVSINDLFPYETINDDNNSRYTYYPTAISAGLPLEVDGITEASKISISDEVLGKYANDRDIFFVRANGESMNNLFEDGSLLAIKPVTLDNLKNGDIVVYSTNGEYSVKHYHKTATNIIFRANSRTFEYFDDIHELDAEIKIHGKVVTYIVNVD